MTSLLQTIHAPAKLNLFFEVYGKRSDGYHEIASLAVPVRLFDTLTFQTLPDPTWDGTGIDFQCHGASDDVPNDETNIVVRALGLLQRKTGTQHGARVQLFKRIPSQAGLGGGSSNAAAVLLVANEAWKLGLSMKELTELSAEIGSDCPLFFTQGASLARGRGEIIQPVGPSPKMYFVLYKPPEGLSTAKIYEECMKNHDFQFRTPEEFLSVLNCGTMEDVGRCCFNRLEQAAEVVWPRFIEIKRQLSALDCLSVRMTGSGTTFFALCRNAQHASCVAEQLRARTDASTQIFQVSSL